MNLEVEIEAIWDEEDSPKDIKIYDLSDSNIEFLLILTFGNGLYEECRVVGSSREAAYIFIRLLQKGGYEQAPMKKVINKKLYHVGDASFPANDPFIFISPITKDGGEINFENLESDIKSFIKENKH